MVAVADYRRPESVLVVVHTPKLDCLLLERVEDLAAPFGHLDLPIRFHRVPERDQQRGGAESAGR